MEYGEAEKYPDVAAGLAHHLPKVVKRLLPGLDDQLGVDELQLGGLLPALLVTRDVVHAHAGKVHLGDVAGLGTKELAGVGALPAGKRSSHELLGSVLMELNW